MTNANPSVENLRGSQRKRRPSTLCLIKDQKYPLQEISNHGFSFLVEQDKNPFYRGSIIDSITVQNEMNIPILISNDAKIVHITELDAKYFRIGIKYGHNSYDRTINGNIRATRFKPIDGHEMIVSCRYYVDEAMQDEQIIMGHVVDYTMKTMKIKFKGQLENPNEQIISIRVMLNEKEIFKTDKTDINTLRAIDNNECVISFFQSTMNIKEIENINKSIKSKEILYIGLEPVLKYSKLPLEYKGLLADWRLYLDKIKYLMDQEEMKLPDRNASDEEYFISYIEPEIHNKFNEYIETFNSIVCDISKSDIPIYKEYLEEVVGQYLNHSPQGRRIKEKKHGYPGDYETIRSFFENHYQGKSIFGKLINSWICKMVSSTGVVNRVKFMYDYILNKFNAHQGKEPFSILSIGSGPAIEISDFISKNNFDKEVHISLFDLDAIGLVEFKDRLQYSIKPNVVVECINEDIIKEILRKKSTFGRQFDIVYCAGLMDYFNDKACQKIVNYIIKMTKPEGHFLYTNMHDSNPLQYFMQLAGDWAIIHRSVELVKSFTPNQYNVEVFHDYTKTHVVAYGKK